MLIVFVRYFFSINTMLENCGSQFIIIKNDETESARCMKIPCNVGFILLLSFLSLSASQRVNSMSREMRAHDIRESPGPLMASIKGCNQMQCIGLLIEEYHMAKWEVWKVRGLQQKVMRQKLISGEALEQQK